MRILFIASADAAHSHKWIKYFAAPEKKNKIHWISVTENKFPKIPDVKFYKLNEYGNKALDVFLNVFEVRRLIKKMQPDIIHAHYAGVNGGLAALTGFYPFVLTAWGSDVLLAGKDVFKKWLVKYALKKADLITCDAEHMKKAMAELGADPEKIHIIYFGIDTKKFTPKHNANIANSYANLRVISLRNLEPIYNVETLIKSAEIVLKEFPKTRFIIAGRGSEKEKLKNLAEELGVSKDIEFTGFISQDALPNLLQSADVYVSTSLSDAGIAGSTAEAMACGLPVIITDNADNREWVSPESLFPAKNHNALAQKIIEFLKNPESCQKQKIANRKIIEHKNDYYKEMEKMGKLYEKVVTSHQKSG